MTIVRLFIFIFALALSITSAQAQSTRELLQTFLKRGVWALSFDPGIAAQTLRTVYTDPNVRENGTFDPGFVSIDFLQRVSGLRPEDYSFNLYRIAAARVIKGRWQVVLSVTGLQAGYTPSPDFDFRFTNPLYRYSDIDNNPLLFVAATHLNAEARYGFGATTLKSSPLYLTIRTGLVPTANFYFENTYQHTGGDFFFEKLAVSYSGIPTFGIGFGTKVNFTSHFFFELNIFGDILLTSGSNYSKEEIEAITWRANTARILHPPLTEKIKDGMAKNNLSILGEVYIFPTVFLSLGLSL